MLVDKTIPGPATLNSPEKHRILQSYFAISGPAEQQLRASLFFPEFMIVNHY